MNSKLTNQSATSLPEHSEWEREVISAIAFALDVTYSDATGIVLAQPFYMAQSWSKGLDAKATAQKILDEKQ